MTGYNLPPGVTPAMIDDHFGAEDCPACGDEGWDGDACCLCGFHRETEEYDPSMDDDG